LRTTLRATGFTGNIQFGLGARLGRKVDQR